MMSMSNKSNINGRSNSVNGMAMRQSHPSQSPSSSKRLTSRRSVPTEGEHIIHEEQQPRSSSSSPQHHQLTPDPPEDGGPAIFDFFYSLLFSLVHSALTMVLAPVLRKDRRSRRKAAGSSTAESKEQRSPSWRSFIEKDPELAIPNDAQLDEATSVGSSSSVGSYHQPILKTQACHRTRISTSTSTSDKKKSVRFPVPQRSRPPLGRIGVGSSSSPSVSSASSNSSSRSGVRRVERSSSRTALTSGYSSSRRASPRRGNGYRTSSPLQKMAGPRMTHSACFLE